MGQARIRQAGDRARRWGAAALVGVVVGLSGLVFWVHDRNQVAAEARTAREALAARRFNDAWYSITKWMAHRPGAGEPYFLLAKLELAQDRPGPALDAIERARARGYPAGPLDVLRAVLDARAGRSQAAEPLLRRAFDAARGPEPEVDEALARIYLADYRFGSAAEVIARWMKDAPDDPRPYLWRDQVDERIDAPPEDRIRNYRAALKRDPTLAQPRLGLADRLRELGRIDEAGAEYAALLARNPSLVDAHVGAGRNAQLRGDSRSALDHFEEALRLNPREPFVLRELALFDLRSGQTARACDRLELAVTLDPYAPNVRYSYAQALKAAGETERARQELVVFERLKAEHRAMEELRENLVRNPRDSALRCAAAKWLLEHGHDQEGLAWTQVILRDHPGHQATCRLLADYHKKKGNTGLANYYDLAASAPPDRPGKP